MKFITFEFRDGFKKLIVVDKIVSLHKWKGNVVIKTIDGQQTTLENTFEQAQEILKRAMEEEQ